ncbi:hypothetical protein BJP48_00130 [Paenibacillus odorifer]|nr:hypothetical protein BJP48_00130 [Paenibacillus odorifer]
METNLNEKKNDYKPLGISGLGGWLILVQIGLYGTIIIQLMQLFQDSFTAFDAAIWTAFTSKGSDFYHPLWGFIIVFETTFNIAILAFSVYILINFYRKKAFLPRLLIIFYIAIPVVGIIDVVLLYQIPLARELGNGDSLKRIIRSAFTCAIWTAYLLKSERVHNTFVK